MADRTTAGEIRAALSSFPLSQGGSTAKAGAGGGSPAAFPTTVCLVSLRPQNCSAPGMKGRNLIHNRSSLTDRRRELRRNSTKAEGLLWACLRKCQLDGKRFRRQHSIGPYIADFYCPECRVIVELDGAGHKDPIAEEKDAARTRFLESFGIRVLRFENKEVFESLEFVLESIRTALRDSSQGSPPQPRRGGCAE